MSSNESRDDDLIYHPPPAPEPETLVEEVAPEQAPETVAVVRRSRVLVVTVIAASATLLLGAIVAIVMLSSGLLAAIDKSDSAQPLPVVEVPEQVVDDEADEVVEQPYTPPVRSAADECGDLCATLEQEVGEQAGEWKLELAWADAVTEVGAQDAASAVFSSPVGRGTFTVLQFETDAEAAEAAVQLRQRLGEPSYQIELFENGTGVRYDYVGALVSRVVWHPDEASDAHVPGRLYLVEAPTAETPDFSTQPAFLLFLALPI